MNKLRVQVISGLGSRMRAVLAGIAWAKAHGLQVVVHWPRKDPSETLGTFDVGFKELFDSPLDEVVMDRPVTGGVWSRQPKRVGDDWYIRFCEPERLNIEALDLSGWPYPEMWTPGMIVAAYVEKLDHLFWHRKVVGVHIRHALAQNTTPPVDWFIGRMHELRNRYPVAFFLATDAQCVEDQIRSEVPSVFCQPKGDYAYDGNGIARTAADLFLLKRCAWMIGSQGSSFSELAGWLRGGEKSYLPGWGRPGWLPSARYEDKSTPADPAELEMALS